MLKNVVVRPANLENKKLRHMQIYIYFSEADKICDEIRACAAFFHSLWSDNELWSIFMRYNNNDQRPEYWWTFLPSHF